MQKNYVINDPKKTKCFPSAIYHVIILPKEKLLSNLKHRTCQSSEFHKNQKDHLALQGAFFLTLQSCFGKSKNTKQLIL